MHFGNKGNELKQFNTAHGMTLDTRYEPNRLLICDRNHRTQRSITSLLTGRRIHRGSDHRIGHADIGCHPR